MPLVNFKSGADFRRWVPKMPRANYAWAFYGNVDVVKAGTYDFCATSDDGSKVYVDRARVVDNDGLHGPRERCGRIHLGVGKHTVMTEGFQHYGGAYMRLQYKGPDTGHVLKFVKSSSGKAPKESVRSRWTMRVFRAPYGVGLYHVPYDWDLMEFVGETQVRSIDFRGLGQIREVVPETPASQYAWAFYGKVRIHRAGNYYWCTTSDDGYVHGGVWGAGGGPLAALAGRASTRARALSLALCAKHSPSPPPPRSLREASPPPPTPHPGR